jgi:hypothetical protein
MTPQDLKDLVIGEDSDAEFFISKIEIENDRLDVYFTITFPDGSRPEEKWIVRGNGHKENCLSVGYTPQISIEDEHPLLLKYKDNTRCELFFNGNSADPELLAAELYQIDIDRFRRFEPFGPCLDRKNLLYVLQRPNGLLVRGPKNLLLTYGSCLRKHNVDFSIIEGAPRVKAASANGGDLKVFWSADNRGYVIAEEFSIVPQ